MKELVIDTCILGIVANQEEDAMTAAGLLEEILRNHSIAVDRQGTIINEYQNQIVRLDMLKNWWVSMSKIHGKIRYKWNRLDNRQLDALNELGFDPDDVPFVEVAACTSDKVIVTEDSDYYANECRVREYLRAHIGVDVLRMEEARRVIYTTDR